jgi:arsenate reductase (thioredoxin)
LISSSEGFSNSSSKENLINILFVCIQNAGRSQMAAAFFNRMSEGRAWAISAGSHPAAHVHPEVIEVMQEIGIDLSGKTPQLLTTALLASADYVVTMGCGEVCPVNSSGAIRWQIDDPAGKSLDEVRRIREQIHTRVQELLKELGL